jgi:hypothetical protein
VKKSEFKINLRIFGWQERKFFLINFKNYSFFLKNINTNTNTRVLISDKNDTKNITNRNINIKYFQTLFIVAGAIFSSGLLFSLYAQRQK